MASPPDQLRIVIMGAALVVELAACGPGSSGDTASSSDTSSSGTSESGGTEGSETETEGTETGGEELLEGCWTATRTRFPHLSAITDGPEGVVALNRDGLASEAGGWVFDPVLTEEGSPAPGLIRDIIGTPEDLWLIGSGELAHWDGASLEVVDTSPEGTVEFVRGLDDSMWWAGQFCGGMGCNVQLHTFDVDTDTWVEPPQPPVPYYSSFVVGDDEQWLLSEDIDQDLLLHRVGQGAWEIVDFPYEPLAQNVLVASADGGLWVVMAPNDPMQPTTLLWRTPMGVWVEGSAAADGEWDVIYSALASAGMLYFKRWQSNELWRWDAVGSEAEVVLEVPGSVYAEMFGYAGRVLLQDFWLGPGVTEVELDPTPSASSLYDRISFDAWGLSAPTLERAYAAGKGGLLRWDADAWTLIHDDGGLPTYSAGFIDVWADSEDSAWAIQHIAYGQGDLHTSSIWRIEGDSASVDFELPLYTWARAVWGRAPDDVFVLGSNELDSNAPWHFDGNGWTQMSVPQGMNFYGPQLIAGDDDEVYVFDVLARMRRFDGSTWTELPTLPGNRADEAAMALAGDQLFVAYEYTTDDIFEPETFRYFQVWDGVSWEDVSARWPEAPDYTSSLAGDDAGGMFVRGGGGLLYFDGEVWAEVVGPDEPLGGVEMSATAQGAFFHPREYGGSEFTHQFRWDCP